MQRLFWLFGFLVGWAGCQDASEQTDANPASDGNAAEDGSMENFLPDLELGGAFAIVVPPGTQACTGCYQNWRDIDYWHMGKISFRPGVIRLPKDQAEIESDWIEKIELGQDRIVPTASAPGVFSMSLEGTQDNGIYHYEYTQAFTVNQVPFSILFKTYFKVIDGVATDPVLFLNSDTMKSDLCLDENRFVLEGYWDDGSLPQGQVYLQRYLTCQRELPVSYQRKITIDNGDSILVTHRCHQLSQCIQELNCVCDARSVVFTRGAENRQTSDFYHLVYATVGAYHHWGDAYFIVLDEPLGQIAGFWLQTILDAGSGTINTANYLDSGLNVLETRKITDVHQE